MTARHAFVSLPCALTCALAGALSLPAYAQTVTHAKPAHVAKSAPAKKAAAPEIALPDASPEQANAAAMVFYGKYDCEFNQKIDIAQDAKHSGYVDVRFSKSDWLMKPVLSPTGAIRLEDVRGEALVVQIAAKSMLLNVKTGHRLVDDCISPGQRQLKAASS